MPHSALFFMDLLQKQLNGSDFYLCKTNDVHEVKSDTVFNHMKQNAGVDGIGEVAKTTKDETETENINADIPLAVSDAKNN